MVTPPLPWAACSNAWPLWVKKFFLIPNLNLPWCDLRPLPLVLLLVTWEKVPLGGTLGTWQSLGFFHHAWAASPEPVLFFFFFSFSFFGQMELFIFTIYFYYLPAPASPYHTGCWALPSSCPGSGQPSVPASASGSTAVPTAGRLTSTSQCSASKKMSLASVRMVISNCWEILNSLSFWHQHSSLCLLPPEHKVYHFFPFSL